MKKLLLSLLCIGGILALPGCGCCRKSCEVVRHEDCDYDDCDKENYDDEVIEREYQEGRETGRKYRNGGNRREMREEIGHEEQQGVVTRRYYKGEKEPQAPRKVMMKPVHPQVIAEAEAAGKQCRFLNPEHGKMNKQMNKEARVTASSNKRAPRALKDEVQEMDMDRE